MSLLLSPQKNIHIRSRPKDEDVSMARNPILTGHNAQQTVLNFVIGQVLEHFFDSSIAMAHHGDDIGSNVTNDNPFNSNP
jgi:hypothetical protein